MEKSIIPVSHQISSSSDIGKVSHSGFRTIRQRDYVLGESIGKTVGGTYWGPVHTNPFSNENGAVLLRFQKDLRPNLSFSPVHTTTPIKREATW